MGLHIRKLVVGLDSLDEFAAWQAQEAERIRYDGRPASCIRTRFMPKQADEILDSGGSAYRIIKGKMCCRQKIIGFEMQGEGKAKSCLIYTNPDIIETAHMPHRPFQGWRYLKPADAPPDIGPYRPGQKAELPPELAAELRDAGLL